MTASPQAFRHSDPGASPGRVLLAALPRTGMAFFERFGRLAPVQMAAIPDLLSGKDLLISAPTAGGKTEAVAAPLAERHLSLPWPGVSLLYVCPTRALVNDLYRRLAPPLERLGIGLGRKTSDHPVTPKEKLPAWIVTTPESLDSLLVRRPRDLLGVRAVVLDEIHLLDGTPRGDQLRVLVARLRRIHEAALKRGERPQGLRLQTVLLSATIPDPEATVACYAPGATIVRVPGARVIETLGTQLAIAGSLAEALKRIPRTEASKLLVFTRSRAECEQVAAALYGSPPYGTDVYAHHGSLSRRTRLAAEEAFHRAPQAVFVATSTLELGIDIGDVDWVVQFGPPGNVASFLQQIGRGCRRRKDVTRVMAVARNAVEEILFEVLLGAARAGEVASPPRVFTASVLAQQVASYLLQRSTGTVGVAEFMSLLAMGAPPVPEADVRALVAAMVEKGLLAPARGGRHAAGPELERWLERQPRKLHGNIGTPTESVAVLDSETQEPLGEVQASGVPPAGRVAFAGRAGELKLGKDGRYYLHRTGADPAAGTSAPTYWTARQPMSLSLAQTVRRHLGIEPGVVPVVLAPDKTLAVLPFLGGCGTRAVALYMRARKFKVRQITDVAVVLETPPLLEGVKLDGPTLEQVVNLFWKQLEQVQDPGAHVRLVPDDLRCKQVLERLIAEGFLEVTAQFQELKYFIGPQAQFLKPFVS